MNNMKDLNLNKLSDILNDYEKCSSIVKIYDGTEANAISDKLIGLKKTLEFIKARINNEHLIGLIDFKLENYFYNEQ